MSNVSKDQSDGWKKKWEAGLYWCFGNHIVEW